MNENELQKNYSPEQLEALKTNLMNIYQVIIEKQEELQKLWESVCHLGSPVSLNIRFKTNNRDIKWNIEREFDRDAWEYFFGSANLQDIMSQKELESYHKRLDDPEPFTAEAARKYIANGFEIAKNVLDNLVKEVFDKLISSFYIPGGNYNKSKKKMNNMKIDKWFRTCESITKCKYGRGWEEYYRRPAIFNDLEKCCYILDGKKPPRHPDKICDRLRGIDGNVIENEYFEVVLYKVGNQKVRFKRLDILKKLNKYGAPGNSLGQDIRVSVFK